MGDAEVSETQPQQHQQQQHLSFRVMYSYILEWPVTNCRVYGRTFDVQQIALNREKSMASGALQTAAK